MRERDRGCEQCMCCGRAVPSSRATGPRDDTVTLWVRQLLSGETLHGYVQHIKRDSKGCIVQP